MFDQALCEHRKNIRKSKADKTLKGKYKEAKSAVNANKKTSTGCISIWHVKHPSAAQCRAAWFNITKERKDIQHWERELGKSIEKEHQERVEKENLERGEKEITEGHWKKELHENVKG